MQYGAAGSFVHAFVSFVVCVSGQQVVWAVCLERAQPVGG
jgi:hypothetical protein